MRKTLILGVLVGLLSAASAFAAEPVKIGYLAALTGNDAAYGVAEVQSAQMYVTKRNNEGGVLGRPIELVVYDSKSRPEDAVNAVRRMIESDHVVAIVGSNTSGINIATAALVNEAKVPQIGTATTNPLVTVDPKGNVRPYSFRLTFDDPYQGFLGADFALKDLGAKTAAVIYNVGSDYAHGLREYFINYFEEHGGMVIADESYRPDDVDFRAQLTKIKEANPDVVVLPTMGKCTPLSVKQARELGISVPIIGGDGYGDYFWEIAGAEAMKNTFWVSHVAKEDPALKDFFDKYKKQTGTECQEFMNAVMAYDSVYWLADAITRANSTDPQKVRDALEQTKDLQLMHTKLTMDEFHNPKNKDGYMLEAKDGSAVFYKRIRPEA